MDNGLLLVKFNILKRCYRLFPDLVTRDSPEVMCDLIMRILLLLF